MLIGTTKLDHMIQATNRLLILSQRLRRWDGVDDFVNALKSKGEFPVYTNYLYAKSLIVRSLPREALLEIEKIAQRVKDESIRWKTEFLLAVTHVQLGNYIQAETIFRNIAAYESDYVGSIRVRELTNINSARILLELGDVSAAIDAYQSVKRESPYFAEALFELAWAYLIGAEDKGNDIDRS